MTRIAPIWNDIPAPTLVGLCRQLRLDTSDPFRSLAAEYGEFEPTAFIQDTWVYLRQAWLRTDGRRDEIAGRVAKRLGRQVPEPDRAQAFLMSVDHDSALRLDVAAVLMAAAPPSAEREPATPHTGVWGGTSEGWFPDPWGLADLRWWDGGSWTGHVSGARRDPTEAAGSVHTSSRPR